MKLINTTRTFAASNGTTVAVTSYNLAKPVPSDAVIATGTVNPGTDAEFSQDFHADASDGVAPADIARAVLTDYNAYLARTA